MAVCPKCLASIKDNDKFCPKCGEKLSTKSKTKTKKKGHPLAFLVLIGLFLLFTMLYCITPKTNPELEHLKTLGQSPSGVQAYLDQTFTKPELTVAISRYSFEPRSNAGTINLWVKTDFFYDLSASQQKDLVYSIGSANNVNCARNGYSIGCNTQFYSEANRLIAEYTITGSVKIY